MKVAPRDEPDETRVIATVDPDRGTVTSIDEPVTLEVSNAVSIDASEYEIDRDGSRAGAVDDANATRRSADRALEFRVTEPSTDRGGDGSFSVDADGGTVTAILVEGVTEIDPSADTGE